MESTKELCESLAASHKEDLSRAKDFFLDAGDDKSLRDLIILAFDKKDVEAG